MIIHQHQISNENTLKDRIEWIDVLRGLASISVMILHFYHQILIILIPTAVSANIEWENASQRLLGDTISFYETYAANSPLLDFGNFIFNGYDLGKLGVLIFFLISGFVIPYSISKKHLHPLKSFAISRFFRLYPIYWFSLIIIGGVIWPFFTPEDIDLGLFYLNLTMLQKFFLQSDINGVAWTLQLEIIFYVSCALLFGFGLLKHSKIIQAIFAFFVLSGLIGAATAYLFNLDLPLGLPLGLSFMWLGYCTRPLFLNKDNFLSKKSAWLTITMGLPIILLACILGYGGAGLRYAMTYALAIGIYLFVGLALKPASKILQWLGSISYSLYLLHGIVAFFILKHCVNLINLPYTTSSFWLLIPLTITGIISIFVSHLTYNYIEKPSIHYGKYLINRVNKNSFKLETVQQDSV